MNPEAKALWTAALRSGEYQQGKWSLNANGKLCCLGVLCEVAVKAGVRVRVRVRVKTTTTYDLRDNEKSFTIYDGEDMVPPPSVREWAGLDRSNPMLTSDEGVTLAAAEWNDRQDASFRAIADMIDSNL
jgi:hypothetical protein